MRTSVIKVISLAVVAAFLAATSSGCGLLDRTPLTVPDPEGVYHLNVPKDWSFSGKPGMVSIYAGKEIPEDGTLDELSVVIMTSNLGDKSETPTPKEAIEEFATWRADTREWKNPKMSKVTSATIGDAPANVMEVSGTDKSGVSFKGRYYLTRTATKEVFIMAVAPADRWTASAKQLDIALKENWYWHAPTK
jgi:hypothetical protein